MMTVNGKVIEVLSLPTGEQRVAIARLLIRLARLVGEWEKN